MPGFVEVPRRSVLYMPGVNQRALQKAQSLVCDSLIFDLEDAVAPSMKDQARAQVVAALTQFDYGYRERIVRINGLDTPWGNADLQACASLNLDGLLIPKVESSTQIELVAQRLREQDQDGLPLWLMIETPIGVLGLNELLRAQARIAGLVVGSNDLVQELRAQHSSSRSALVYCLSQIVLVGRAHRLVVLDGVPTDVRDLEKLRQSTVQGRELGFDGRTLIHPDQLAIANEVYGPSRTQIEHSQRIMHAWSEASAQGRGVVEVDGALVEQLHVREAERILQFAALVDARR